MLFLVPKCLRLFNNKNDTSPICLCHFYTLRSDVDTSSSHIAVWKVVEREMREGDGLFSL